MAVGFDGFAGFGFPWVRGLARGVEERGDLWFDQSAEFHVEFKMQQAARGVVGVERLAVQPVAAFLADLCLIEANEDGGEEFAAFGLAGDGVGFRLR